MAQHVPSLATHYINDTAAGTLGHTLIGVAGTDIIFAGPGDDVITPGAGNDYVFAGTGNNTIVATVGDGNDIYNGGAGTDTYDMSGDFRGGDRNPRRRGPASHERRHRRAIR